MFFNSKKKSFWRDNQIFFEPELCQLGNVLSPAWRNFKCVVSSLLLPHLIFLVIVSGIITFRWFWHCWFSFPYCPSSFASPSGLVFSIFHLCLVSCFVLCFFLSYLFLVIVCFPNYFSYFLVLYFFSFSISVSSLFCSCSSSILLCSWILKSHSGVSISVLLSF